jgi:tRNA uridine 5-carboxymethylaminomethyl modification enzyme
MESRGISVNQDGRRRTAAEVLSYPDRTWNDVARIWPELAAVEPRIAEAVSIDALYAVYLDRQTADIASVRSEEARLIPADFDYDGLSGLSNELKLKLNRHRPQNVAQAARIEGMTPAAVALLITLLRRTNERLAS